MTPKIGNKNFGNAFSNEMNSINNELKCVKRSKFSCYYRDSFENPFYNIRIQVLGTCFLLFLMFFIFRLQTMMISLRIQKPQLIHQIFSKSLEKYINLLGQTIFLKYNSNVES